MKNKYSVIWVVRFFFSYSTLQGHPNIVTTIFMTSQFGIRKIIDLKFTVTSLQSHLYSKQNTTGLQPFVLERFNVKCNLILLMHITNGNTGFFFYNDFHPLPSPRAIRGRGLSVSRCDSLGFSPKLNSTSRRDVRDFVFLFGYVLHISNFHTVFPTHDLPRYRWADIGWSADSV